MNDDSLLQENVERAYGLADKGEIVSSTSGLAMDEELVCKKCGKVTTISNAKTSEKHELYARVTRYGYKCSHCENVNWAYVKTPTLLTLEKRIKNAPMQLKQKARKKYQREFRVVQKQFGMV